MNKQLLMQIKKDVQRESQSKDVLLEEYVRKRLNHSLQSYHKELMQNYESLIYKNALKIIRTLNRSNV